MKQVCELLKVKQIRPSVYHPQTDGLVERYNRTIKTMLRKSIEKAGRDWDRQLPLVLFAIRTHEQKSTSFSPFELLFGRKPHTLLDMAAEQWTEEEDEGRPLIQYAATLRETLTTLWEEVHTNMESAQAKQKQLYDRHTKLREFAAGDQVLILLPTSEKKLLATWQGPYKVLGKVTPVTYRIDVPHKQATGQIYHVNLLKAWEEPVPVNSDTGTAIHCATVNKTMDISLAPVLQEQAAVVQLGPQVTEEQKRRILSLCETYSSVLSGVPGHITLVEHDIVTNNTRPIKLKPYRIPEARRRAVEQEPC